VTDYLTKGCLVFVSGRLRCVTFLGKDKVERQQLEITAGSVTVLNERKPEFELRKASEVQIAPPGGRVIGRLDDLDDEIPF